VINNNGRNFTDRFELAEALAALKTKAKESITKGLKYSRIYY
jgi:hypothetical protein